MGDRLIFVLLERGCEESRRLACLRHLLLLRGCTAIAAVRNSFIEFGLELAILVKSGGFSPRFSFSALRLRASDIENVLRGDCWV